MAKSTRLTVDDMSSVIIGGGDLGILERNISDEIDLKRVADRIKKTDSFGAIFRLVDGLPSHDSTYDWNACCILRYFDLDLITETLRQIGDLRPFYESIGLASIFGEYGQRDSFVIDFLYAVVREAKSDRAWWRAAFSLELIGVESAVSLLKRSLKGFGQKNLAWCLDHLEDRRATVSILALSNAENTEKEIYPRLREIFLRSEDVPKLVGATWLIGRLGLVDDDIVGRFAELARHRDYELSFYAFFGMQSCGIERLRPQFEAALVHANQLIRRMAARGLADIGDPESLPRLESVLSDEHDSLTATELCQAIYRLRHPSESDRLLVGLRPGWNENGLTAGRGTSQKSPNPALLHALSLAEDPDGLCFRLIRHKLGRRRVENPTVFACGTGRVLHQIVKHLDYAGTAVGLESDAALVEFVRHRLREEHLYTRPVNVIHLADDQIPPNLKLSSDLVIWPFIFPDVAPSHARRLNQLKVIHDLLTDDGVLITVGWDDKFNDEFSHVWYEHVPDDLPVKDFDHWRQMKAEAADSPHNLGLGRWKTGLVVPVRFSSLRESTDVMGYFFGRDAAEQAVRSGRTEWRVSLGMTFNTKKDIERLLKDVA